MMRISKTTSLGLAKLCPAVKQSSSGTKTLFSEVETILCAAETGFSITKKTVGEAPTVFITTQKMLCLIVNFSNSTELVLKVAPVGGANINFNAGPDVFLNHKSPIKYSCIVLCSRMPLFSSLNKRLNRQIELIACFPPFSYANHGIGRADGILSCNNERDIYLNKQARCNYKQYPIKLQFGRSLEIKL
jgi:hypothetical protein